MVDVNFGVGFLLLFFFKWKQIVSERGKFRPWSGMAVAPSLPTVSSGGPRWCSRGLWVPEVGTVYQPGRGESAVRWPPSRLLFSWRVPLTAAVRQFTCSLPGTQISQENRGTRLIVASLPRAPPATARVMNHGGAQWASSSPSGLQHWSLIQPGEPSFSFSREYRLSSSLTLFCCDMWNWSGYHVATIRGCTRREENILVPKARSKYWCPPENHSGEEAVGGWGEAPDGGQAERGRWSQRLLVQWPISCSRMSLSKETGLN